MTIVSLKIIKNLIRHLLFKVSVFFSLKILSLHKINKK